MGLFNKLFKKNTLSATKKEVDSSAINEIGKILFEAMTEQVNPERAIAIFQGQRPNDDDFGYSVNNPICATTISDSKEYLSRLRTECGEELYWIRDGAIYLKELHGVEDVPVDIYNLYCHGEIYKKVYVCPYGQNSEYAPKGLVLSNQIDERKYKGSIEKEAAGEKLLKEQVLALHRLKYENEQYRKKKIEEQQQRDKEIQNMISKQAIAVKEKYHKFDLQIEMKNDLFSALAVNGVDLILAYEYVHRAELFVPIEKPLFNYERNVSFDNKYYSYILSKYVKLKELPSIELLEDELIRKANEKGLTVPQFRAMINLERNNIMMENNQKKEKIEKWAGEAVVTKQKYSDFDIEKVITNEKFMKLIEYVEVITAYEIVYFKDIFVIRNDNTSNKTSDRIDEAFFCRKCGVKLPSDSVFCYKCGEKVI